MPCFPMWNVDATKVLTRRELAEVLADATAKARRSANARRNLIIVRLACCCGLRVSEIAGLKLPLELMGLQELGFDLHLTGFSADELLRLMGSDSTARLTDPDDVPEPPDEAITQPGTPSVAHSSANTDKIERITPDGTVWCRRNCRPRNPPGPDAFGSACPR